MFDLIPYRLPLVAPLSLARGDMLHAREGLLLHDRESGGWGDAAPLPGFSVETLAEVRASAERGDWAAPGCPSLRFAVECARKPLERLAVPVGVSFLWRPEAESLGELLSRLEGAEEPVVKVKLGEAPDLSGVLELLKGHPTVRLRLDPNRRWSVETTIRVTELVDSTRLEALEEPLSNPLDYPLVWDSAPAPIALDESLLLPEGRELAEAPGVRALVLKPTLLGDAADRAPWIRLAETCGKRLYWSSSFESGVGLWHLAVLAEGGVPCGLDTGRVFAEDVVSPRPLPVGGVLSPCDWRVTL